MTPDAVEYQEKIDRMEELIASPGLSEPEREHAHHVRNFMVSLLYQAGLAESRHVCPNCGQSITESHGDNQDSQACVHGKLA